MPLTLLGGQPATRVAQDCSLGDEVSTVVGQLLKLLTRLVQIDGRHVSYGCFYVGTNERTSASYPVCVVVGGGKEEGRERGGEAEGEGEGREKVKMDRWREREGEGGGGREEEMDRWKERER